jgi:hypothetical protein
MEARRMSIRFGQMDRLVEIHKYVKPTSSLNTDNYSYSRSDWMNKKPLTADERFSTDVSQRYSYVLVRFTAYWIQDLAVTDILYSDGQWFDIKAITEIGYREAMQIDGQIIQKPSGATAHG